MTTLALLLLLASTPEAPPECFWSAAPDGHVYPFTPTDCMATIVWDTPGLKQVCLAKPGYVTFCDTLLVTDPHIFSDGFESGAVIKWSSHQP